MKKMHRRVLGMLLVGAMIAGICDLNIVSDKGIGTEDIAKAATPIPSEENDHPYEKGCYSNTYTNVPTSNPGRAWRDGMVSGNGENGYVTSGAPYTDTFIFMNMWFNFPSSEPREIPAILPTQLEEARENVFNLNAGWRIKEANGNTRSRTFYYSYHPGHQLRLNMDSSPAVSDYERWTNYETAETGVRYTNSDGEWMRRSFTSREDNVSITEITQSSYGAKVNMTISIDDISSMYKAYDNLSKVTELRYKKLVDDDANYIAQVAHYPSYARSELKEAGYAGVTYVVTVGGTKEKILLANSNESMNVGSEKNPAIKVSDADAVYLITKLDRTFDMGPISSFAAESGYDLVDDLIWDTEDVALKYKSQYLGFDYEKALAPHAAWQKKEFNAVSFRLDGDDEDKSEPNETLIQIQQNKKDAVNHAFMERVYDQGRYAEICCSGQSAPRLYGMWCGEWNAGWRSIYTLDANVNLQVSPMNTGHLTEAQLGYITFFLRNAPDFEYNAEMAYGMHDAIQISVNSDGDRAMHVEYDNSYPFQYWNAGPSWCLLPIYEYWQCYGNQKIPINDNMRFDDLASVLSVEDEDLTDEQMSALKERGWLDLEKDILLPLLTKQANFWEQIVTPRYYVDANGISRHDESKTELNDGEKYIIIPAYSPENNPIGYNSTITANATMDISAARDGLKMIIDIENRLKRPGYEDAVEKWEDLLSKLPNYLYDSDGALKEWAMSEYRENNNHRHLSHLYVAWPAYETQNDEDLSEAANKALDNRNRYNTGDATAGHGWMHKALVEARLKRGDGMISSLLPMMNGTAYYTSMMTDHDTNRRNDTYCTDTSFGTIGAVNESLLFSNTSEIELLPALPSDWTSGSIKGMMARTRAEVKDLTWDVSKGYYTATIKSDIDQNIKLSCKPDWADYAASDPSKVEEDGWDVILKLKAGDEITVSFYENMPSVDELNSLIASAENKLASKPANDFYYNEDASKALAAAIEKAKAVALNAQSGLIRDAIWDLESAIDSFDEAYEYKLSYSLAGGIYNKCRSITIKHSANSRFEVRYTTDGSAPDKNSKLYTKPFTLKEGITILRAVQLEKGTGKVVVDEINDVFQCNPVRNQAQGATASIDRPTWSSGESAPQAVDGDSSTRLAVRGNFDTYTLDINLGGTKTFNNLMIDEYVEVVDKEIKRITGFTLYVSDDGTDYKEAASFDDEDIDIGERSYVSDGIKHIMIRPERDDGASHAYYACEFEKTSARYVRLVMTATKEISVWEFGLYNNIDRSALRDVISIVEDLNEADYTPASWALIKETMDKANALLKAADIDPSQITECANELKNAIESLVPAPKPTTAPGPNTHNGGKTTDDSKATDGSGTANSTSDSQNAKSALKAPKKLKAKAYGKSGKKAGMVKLTWKKVKGAGGYQIFSSKKKNKGYKKVGQTKKGKKVTFVDKKALKKNEVRYYRVRAYKKVNGKKVYGKYARVRYRRKG